MHPIHILWAVPRSTSTAFEWMMRMRGDMICFHEPFGEAWYKGEDARAPRLSAESPRTPGLSFASVIDKMARAAERRPVFSKDMAQFAEHLFDEAFFDRYQHGFLIRDPAKMLASLQRSYAKSINVESFTRQEISVVAQRRLFERLKKRGGAPPVVIDSDDLLVDPPRMVEAYCRAIGIPFIAEALNWEPGSRAEVLWFDGDDSVWHGTLARSDGLKPQPRREVDIADLSAEMQELHAEFLPHYQYLHAHRLI